MPLIPLTPQELDKVKIKIPKRYFSLPAFWSSPQILEFTPEQYLLIALKNACSYLSVFDLIRLFGIENVEILWNRHKKDFGKRCREYIDNAIVLYREKENILNSKIEIDLPKKDFYMKKETEKVLEKIKDFKFFKEKKAVLMGGTALSIHLKHRLSEDLDFMFYKDNKLPRDELLLFADKYKANFLSFDKMTEDEFLNEGGDIYDYQQKFIIDGVKIEFVTNLGNILEKEIINESNIETYQSIPIASLDSLKKLKSLLVMDRNKIRDLYDVVYMIKNNILTTKEFIDTIKKYRLTYDENYILNTLKNKKLSSNDEGLENLVDNPPSFEELRDFLINEIAKEMLNGIEKKHSSEVEIVRLNEGVLGKKRKL